jgi:hypothetical protein
MRVTRLPIAALAWLVSSRMKITSSHYGVSACEKVRSSLQANASSRSVAETPEVNAAANLPALRENSRRTSELAVITVNNSSHSNSLLLDPSGRRNGRLRERAGSSGRVRASPTSSLGKGDPITALGRA